MVKTPAWTQQLRIRAWFAESLQVSPADTPGSEQAPLGGCELGKGSPLMVWLLTQTAPCFRQPWVQSFFSPKPCTGQVLIWPNHPSPRSPEWCSRSWRVTGRREVGGLLPCFWSKRLPGTVCAVRWRYANGFALPWVNCERSRGCAFLSPAFVAAEVYIIKWSC